jgi:hypothetical protein
VGARWVLALGPDCLFESFRVAFQRRGEDAKGLSLVKPCPFFAESTGTYLAYLAGRIPSSTSFTLFSTTWFAMSSLLP